MAGLTHECLSLSHIIRRCSAVNSDLSGRRGTRVISGGYFQAHGRPILSLFLTLLRQLFFLIPSLILLPFLFEKVHIAGIYGLDGVWSAHAFSDLLAGMIAIFFLVREYLRHARRAAGL